MPDDITAYNQIRSGTPLYAYESKKKKKVVQDGNRNPTGVDTNTLANTGGLKGAGTGYTDYRTGEWVPVDLSTPGWGGYKNAEAAQAGFDFTKQYNEDPVFRSEAKEGRKHKTGLAGGITSLVEPAFEHGSMAWETAVDNPSQALLGGMTPAGAELWNNVAGTDFEPQTTWTGGATDQQIAQMEADGIGTDNFQKANALADTVALAYAGSYGADAIGGAAGGGASAGNNPGSSFYSGPSSGESSNFLSSLFGGGGGGGMSNTNWFDLLNAGSSLTSGYLSHEATEEGIDEIKRQYDTTRADMAPWRKAGVRALGDYEDQLNTPVQEFEFNLEDDPVYQFQLAEAQKATERAMGARGYNNSGNVLLELQRNAIGEAGRYQNDAFNRQLGASQTNYGRDFDRTNQYANLAGLGQSTTNALATTGANAANNLSNLYLQQGAGYNNAAQGLMQNYMLNNYLNG